MRCVVLIIAALLAAAHVAAAWTYSASILAKAAVPALSIANARGQGYSPCTCTFNPAFIPAGPGLNASINIVRVSGCPESFGGAGDHLMYAFCDNAAGTCGDLQPFVFPFEKTAEDPRVFIYDGYYYLYYFAAGPGQNTVFLRRTKTPLAVDSWELVAANLPWHRNGCVMLQPDGTHYVLFGESPPLPGLGIATTQDFATYKYVNLTYMKPLGPNNTAEPEIVIEAGSTPVQLSTGDYFHLYAAGTPGWVANGNYTGGWIVIDGKDPSRILQRSATHLFVPTMDYEIGNGIYPVQRNRTIFTTAVVPLGGRADNGGQVFRVWYGAADANVASAIIVVTATAD
eukprot:m.255140 g.255140  ORF g.255140 m.255140 type:complete len:342 (+) comp19314_c0_seq1:15-1040(+)